MVVKLDTVCPDMRFEPKYATDLDACMDLRIKVENLIGQYVLQPGTTAVFGTGIQVKIPKDHVMLILPRSSTGFKLQCRFANGTAVIDAGYRDEIKLAIHNFGNRPVVLDNGQRVAQFMVIPRPKVKINFVQDDDKFRENDRNGGIGSTGK